LLRRQPLCKAGGGAAFPGKDRLVSGPAHPQRRCGAQAGGAGDAHGGHPGADPGRGQGDYPLPRRAQGDLHPTRGEECRRHGRHLPQGHAHTQAGGAGRGERALRGDRGYARPSGGGGHRGLVRRAPGGRERRGAGGGVKVPAFG